MRKKFRVRSSHLQIGLWDAGSLDSYPTVLPETFANRFVFGDRGVVVITANDQEIDVWVVSGDESGELPDDMVKLAENDIEFGGDGLEAGNIITKSVYEIDWKAGRTKVEVWVNNEEFATMVIFALTSR